MCFGPKLQGAGRVPRDGFVMMMTRQICRIARNQILGLLAHPTSSRGGAGGYTFAGELPMDKHDNGSFQEFVKATGGFSESCVVGHI